MVGGALPTWLLLAAFLILSAVYVYGFYDTRLPTFESRLDAPEFKRIDVLLLVSGFDNIRYWLFDRWFGVPRSVGMVDRLPLLFWAAAILAVATALGWLSLVAIRVDKRLDRLETFVFSAAVGLSVASTYVLTVGLIGWVRSPLVYALPAALIIAVFGRIFARRIRQGGARPAEQRPTDDGTGVFSPHWLWLTAPFVLILILGGMLPPLSFDVLEYHLQAPKEWYLQGQITFLPHNVYANMPAGAGMFALLGMGLTGDWWLGALVGKTVLAMMAPITALALLAAGRRFFSTSAGVIAALVYISTPWILRVSTSGMVEGAVALYTLTAIYAATLWKLGKQSNAFTAKAPSRGRRPTEDGATSGDPSCTEGSAPQPSGGGDWKELLERGLGLVLLAGYLAGAAVSVKYPPALFLVVPLFVWFVVASWKEGLLSAAERRTYKTDWKSVLLAAGVFLLAVVLGCGLWLGKNWVLTGNPTYPLLYEVFGGASWTPEQNAQWNAVHRPDDFSATALGDDLATVLLRSEWLSPLLFPLAVLALLDHRRRRLVIGLTGYCVFVVAAWWLLTHRIDRFWVPMLSVVALLAGVGACVRGERPWRLAMAIVLLLGLGMNLITALTAAVHDQSYAMHLKRLRLDPARYDPWHLVLNTRWDRKDFNPHGPDSRLMTVGEAAVFDLTMPVDYATCFDDCPLETVAKGRTPAQIHAELRRRGIAMIYVDWSEIRRYRETGYGFTDFVQPEVLDELVDAGVLRMLPKIQEHEGEVYVVR